MNIGKVLNTSIATVFFTLFLAITLPVFNNPDMSAFQAFVLTPVLMMLAGLGAMALFHGLDWARTCLRQAYHSSSGHSSQGDHKGPGNCLPARRTAKRTGKGTGNPVEDAGVGRWAA